MDMRKETPSMKKLRLAFVIALVLGMAATACAAETRTDEITPETLTGTWVGVMTINGNQRDEYTLTFSERGNLLMEERFLGSYDIDLAAYEVIDGAIHITLRTGYFKSAEADIPCEMIDGQLYLTIDKDEGPCVFSRVGRETEKTGAK
jgi:hypothetical protein